MTKIKILLGIISLLTLISLLHLTSYIFFKDSSIQIASIRDVTIYLGNAQSSSTPGNYNSVLELTQSIFLLSGLLLSFKCIYDIIKSGFFTSNSKKLMHYAGLIFLCSGIIAISYDSVRLFGNTENLLQITIIVSIFTDFLLTVIGLIILIISDMSRIGFEIKSENDLVI